MAEVKIDLDAGALARGRAVLTRFWQLPGGEFAAGTPAGTKAPKRANVAKEDLAKACFALQNAADQLAVLATARGRGVDIFKEPDIADIGTMGGRLADAEKYGVGKFYRAAQYAQRYLYRTSTAEYAGWPTMVVPPVDIPGAWHIVGLVVLGITAPIASAWYLHKRLQMQRAIEIERARAMSAAYRDIEIAKAEIAAGRKPSLPPSILSAGNADAVQRSPITWGLGGAAIGGACTMAVYKAYKSPRVRRAGARAVSRLRRRSNPARPRRRRNPLVQGYSERAIEMNIRRELRRGKSPSQASAIAYGTARKVYRQRHPGRALPARLRPRSRSSSTTARTRRKASGRKGRPVRRRANPKQRTITRKGYTWRGRKLEIYHGPGGWGGWLYPKDGSPPLPTPVGKARGFDDAARKARAFWDDVRRTTQARIRRRKKNPSRKAKTCRKRRSVGAARSRTRRRTTGKKASRNTSARSLRRSTKRSTARKSKRSSVKRAKSGRTVKRSSKRRVRRAA